MEHLKGLGCLDIDEVLSFILGTLNYIPNKTPLIKVSWKLGTARDSGYVEYSEKPDDG
jgi:hypothetical protein